MIAAGWACGRHDPSLAGLEQRPGRGRDSGGLDPGPNPYSTPKSPLEMHQGALRDTMQADGISPTPIPEKEVVRNYSLTPCNPSSGVGKSTPRRR